MQPDPGRHQQEPAQPCQPRKLLIRGSQPGPQAPTTPRTQYQPPGGQGASMRTHHIPTLTLWRIQPCRYGSRLSPDSASRRRHSERAPAATSGSGSSSSSARKGSACAPPPARRSRRARASRAGAAQCAGPSWRAGRARCAAAMNCQTGAHAQRERRRAGQTRRARPGQMFDPLSGPARAAAHLRQQAQVVLAQRARQRGRRRQRAAARGRGLGARRHQHLRPPSSPGASQQSPWSRAGERSRRPHKSARPTKRVSRACFPARARSARACCL
jgi:hypothetical protein